MLFTDGLQPNDRGDSAFWANLHKDVKSGKAEKMLTAFPTRYISFELIEISDGSNFSFFYATWRVTELSSLKLHLNEFSGLKTANLGSIKDNK